MYKVAQGLYADVRIENNFSTIITLGKNEQKENKERRDQGAFIRVFDGEKWYFSSISDVDRIQEELDSLAAIAGRSQDIMGHPVVSKMEVHTGDHRTYARGNVMDVDRMDKLTLLKAYRQAMQVEEVATADVNYVDEYKVKTFWSSKGANLEYDYQRCGIDIRARFSVEGKQHNERWATYGIGFSDLPSQPLGVAEMVQECIVFTRDAVDIEPGEYPVILSPLVAGIFAHESFGHKSEADFMLGDASALEDWKIGRELGASCLTIVDDNTLQGHGRVTFDDEGNSGKRTELIKNGKLAGRLHNASTAAYFDEEVTGNARAMNFMHEPMVRMTSTMFEPGTDTKEDLFKGVEDGYYIHQPKHGSGTSEFTIAPSRVYRIRQGQIAEPVRVAVATGNVFKTLYEIDGVSNSQQMYGSVVGGCGKMGQWPLPVAMGGPFVRVKKMKLM